MGGVDLSPLDLRVVVFEEGIRAVIPLCLVPPLSPEPRAVITPFCMGRLATLAVTVRSPVTGVRTPVLRTVRTVPTPITTVPTAATAIYPVTALSGSLTVGRMELLHRALERIRIPGAGPRFPKVVGETGAVSVLGSGRGT